MCSTSEGDQPFNITWFMDNKPIHINDVIMDTTMMNVNHEGSNIQINNYSPFSSILTINSVNAKNSGNYTCRITNVAGSTSTWAELSVNGMRKNRNFISFLT